MFVRSFCFSGGGRGGSELKTDKTWMNDAAHGQKRKRIHFSANHRRDRGNTEEITDQTLLMTALLLLVCMVFTAAASYYHLIAFTLLSNWAIRLQSFKHICQHSKYVICVLVMLQLLSFIDE